MGEQTTDFYEFGRFRLKPDERLLLRGEEFVPLTPKAFDILLTLLENDGRIVRKDDLMKADLFSEIVLLGVGVAIAVTLVMVVMAALTSAAALQ